MNDDEDDLNIELEKLRRKQKIERRGDNSDEIVTKKKGRLDPFDKRSRRFDWKSELEGEDEEEYEEDGTDRDRANESDD